jgi:hypothetical protein
MSTRLFCWVSSSSVLSNVSSTPELSIAADNTEGKGKAVKTDPHARRGMSKAAEMARARGGGGKWKGNQGPGFPGPNALDHTPPPTAPSLSSWCGMATFEFCSTKIWSFTLMDRKGQKRLLKSVKIAMTQILFPSTNYKMAALCFCKKTVKGWAHAALGGGRNAPRTAAQIPKFPALGAARAGVARRPPKCSARRPRG